MTIYPSNDSAVVLPAYDPSANDLVRQLSDEIDRLRRENAALAERCRLIHDDKGYYVDNCKKIHDFAARCGIKDAHDIGLMYLWPLLNEWQAKILRKITEAQSE